MLDARRLFTLIAAPHMPGVAATPRALVGIAEAGPGALPILRQEQQQDRFGGGAPGGSSPFPTLGRGLGSSVVLMDDFRRSSEEEASACLKALLG